MYQPSREVNNGQNQSWSSPDPPESQDSQGPQAPDRSARQAQVPEQDGQRQEGTGLNNCLRLDPKAQELKKLIPRRDVGGFLFRLPRKHSQDYMEWNQ